MFASSFWMLKQGKLQDLIRLHSQILHSGSIEVCCTLFPLMSFVYGCADREV